MGLKLQAEIGLDGSGFERGLNKLGGSLKSTMAGLFTLSAVTNFTKKTIEWASSLRDSADNLGVNVEWLQKMANGAALVGSNLEDVAKFINEMNKSRGQAFQDPKGNDAKAFGRLGISSQDITGLSTQDFFDKLIKAFANGANAQNSNDLQVVGGRAARTLVAAFAAQFQSDAPVLAQDMIDQLDDAGDELETLGKTMMVELAPAIIFAINAIKTFVRYIHSIGTAVGAFTQGWGPILSKLNKAGSISDFKEVWEMMKGQATKTTAAVAKEDNENLSWDQKMEDWLNAKLAARSANEKKPFGFPELNAPRNVRDPRSDDLLKVGNLLGDKTPALQTVAEKQLDIAKRQAALTQETNRQLSQIENKLAARYSSPFINESVFPP